MSEQPSNLPTVSSETLLKLVTPRQVGQWEIACGMGLTEMPESYYASLLVWVFRNRIGLPDLTPDEALDMPLGEILEYQAKVETENPTQLETGDAMP